MTVETDGRRARREQNADTVVDALLDLFADGQLWPTAADIAEQAGVSLRSLFRYFDDLDVLAKTAVTRQMARGAHLFEPLPVDGPFGARVDRLAAHRLAVYEEVGAVVRAARLRTAFQPAIAQGITQRRRELRGQLQALFAPELRSLPSAAEREEVLTALELATGFEALEGLRADRRMAPARAGRVLRRAVVRLLADGADR